MKLLSILLMFFIFSSVISCGEEEKKEEKNVNNRSLCENVVCQDNAECVEEKGDSYIELSVHCECNEGFILDVGMNLCIYPEIDPCENIECQENAECVEGEDAYIETPVHCECNEGFILNVGSNLCVRPEMKEKKIRFMAANITSGDNQAYEEEGIRIFKALKADIIMIQEFNYKSNSKTDVDNFVETTFGAEYSYFKGTPNGNGDIPNGVISKYPITKSGEWVDPRVSDRKIDWVEIKVNNDIKFFVVSVHLKGQEDSSQITAAQIIAKKISEHKKVNLGYYYIVGGDFNGEAAVSNEGFGKYNNENIFFVDGDFPKSEYGDDGNTNRSRTAKLDFILVDENLQKFQTSTDYCISDDSCKKYEDGLVFDSRDYSSSDLSTYFSPVESSDCEAKNMQHLAIVKDFLISDKVIEEKKDILTKEEFNSIFKNPLAVNKDIWCPGYDFYNYEDFITATKEYPLFGNEGSEEIKKREIAAFLANISRETTGGADDIAGGRYLWGLCWIEQIACEDGSCTQYCQESNTEYSCVDGKTYHGRGPIQLTWNYNYGAVGEKIGVDLLSNPELVSTNASISFRTALWFWMTAQGLKPSAHDVMVGNWTPNDDDISKNRKPGFGMTINIINGKNECAKPDDSRMLDRVEHFKFFSELLNTTIGENIYCDEMEHY